MAGFSSAMSHRRVVRLNHGVADFLLRRGVTIRGGSEEREATALTVHRILARRQRDVLLAPRLPHGEAAQLQTGERSFGEVQLGIRQLVGRRAFFVTNDLHVHFFVSFFGSYRAAIRPRSVSATAYFTVVL